MKSREDLQKKLEEILGSSNVYYQPPANVTMKFPAIRYKFEGYATSKADNKNYLKTPRYTLTHMYKNPKNEKVDEILDSFQFVTFEDRQCVDGLYHDIYTLYF